jgi:hypothetical protein
VHSKRVYKIILTTIVLAILIIEQVPIGIQVFAASVRTKQQSISTDATSGKKYALIVCGTSPNQPGMQFTPLHRGDTAYMYHILTHNCSFDWIEYLSVYHNDLGVNGSATLQNVRNAVFWLANNRPNPKSSDIIFIYISAEGVGLCGEGDNHLPMDPPSLQLGMGNISGSENEVSTYYDYNGVLQHNLISVDAGLVLEDTTWPPGNGPPLNAYWGSDLKSDLSGLNGNNGILVYVQQSCFAGDMINALSGPNRTIMCSTKETWSSFGDTGFDTDYPYPDWGWGISEWSERFMDALNGQRAFFWNDTVTINETLYGNPSPSVQADTDGNGVSMLEAWKWALANDQAAIAKWEFPWFDDNGNGLPTYNQSVLGGDILDAADGDLSSRIFLSPLVGDINGDLVVNILDAILLANAFTSKPGSSNWNPSADLNGDGAVNILDAILLANNFLQTRPSIGGGKSEVKQNGDMTGSGANVSVDPSQITVFKGEVFNVSVDVTNVTDLQGWQFQLYWNSTALNCTNDAIVTPTIWQGNTQDYGPGLEANYNSTNGVFSKAEAANYPAPPFNGSMTIATLTFQALQPGTTSLTLADTILGDNTAQPKACIVSSGSVTVYYGRYMRGDTQTINGLNAYILNIPESTSSASVTQSGLESAPSWGMRVFVRHSDGTETEVALDGQTGTPKAVVSGSGLQSANTSVSQTTLQSTDSLVVRVYIWLGVDNGWSLCTTFTTEQLQASTLQAATWTVYYYTRTTFNRLYGFSGTFYWGNTYNSRVQNLQYT